MRHWGLGEWLLLGVEHASDLGAGAMDGAKGSGLALKPAWDSRFHHRPVVWLLATLFMQSVFSPVKCG